MKNAFHPKFSIVSPITKCVLLTLFVIVIVIYHYIYHCISIDSRI